jgi:hypothetical protein
MNQNLNSNNKKNKNKNNTIATATKVFSLATILVAAIVVVTITASSTAEGARFRSGGGEGGNFSCCPGELDAPAVVTGENIYITWWTNNTENGNEEVMFRASTDGGATFGDRINLSNTTEADSWNVEIAGEGDTVVVSWWETNQTGIDVPVARISTDAGETFGPLMRLGMNGTLGSGEAEAVGGETAEEEAVGGAEVAE